MSGALLVPSGACNFAVSLTAISPGSGNITVLLSSNETGPAGFIVTVVVQPAPAPTIVKSFGAPTITVGGSTSVSFTIQNPNAGMSLTGVAATDNLPAGLVVSTPNGLTGSCGGGTITATAGSGSVSLSGATLASSASCTFAVNVTATSAGTKANTVTVTANESGAGAPFSASLTVQNATANPPAITKSFGATAIPVGASASLSFTIQNPNAGSSLTGVAASDILPAGLVVSTPNGLTGSCGGGTITAAAGSGSISLAGATLLASASCTFVVNVTATSAGTKTNTVTVTSNESGAGAPFSASLTVVGAKSNSSTTLVSSQNPSVAGQSVTFTATVTGSPGTPTGTVTFTDGATTLGTIPLTGAIASLTTSSLTAGTHTIAATYGGDAAFLASSASLQQAVNVPADSLKLRQMQIAATNLAAQSSGQAISGAVNAAISDGFNDNPQFMRPSDSGVAFNFAGGDQDGARGFTAEPARQQGRIDETFSALGNAGMPDKAPPRPVAPPPGWQPWVNVRVVDWNRDTPGTDVKGDHVNAIAGLTRRFTPDFLVGALAGYERFEYTSQALTGRLRGDGVTAGSYLGWRFAPHMRFEAAMAYSTLFYDAAAGLATGSFPGNRLLVSGGVSGIYDWRAFAFEPSARVYALWEHQAAYTDSLGTLQADRNFLTGRGSGGARVSYRWSGWPTMIVIPYMGLYADYYFSQDDGLATALASVPLLQGWSARAVSGVGLQFAGGAQVGIGGEVGGLGGDHTMWSVRGRASLPF
jgi:hypothetical protein